MSLLAGATAEAIIKATGGVVVTHGGDSTYGHFEQVPFETEGEFAPVITTKPSVVIPDGILTGIGHKKGVGETVNVGGTDWVVLRPIPADEDGGTLRLILTEA